MIVIINVFDLNRYKLDKIFCIICSPTGKTIRSKVQLIRYLGGTFDLTNFDYQTGEFIKETARGMARTKTVAGGGRSGHSVGAHRGTVISFIASQKIGLTNCLEVKCFSGAKSHVATSSRGGFDGLLTPPNRQTKNISCQPVTLVHTTSKESRPAPSMETRSVGRNEKPRQIFWCKRLENLRPMILRPGQNPEMAQSEPISLPNRILRVYDMQILLERVEILHFFSRRSGNSIYGGVRKFGSGAA